MSRKFIAIIIKLHPGDIKVTAKWVSKIHKMDVTCPLCVTQQLHLQNKSSFPGIAFNT